FNIRSLHEYSNEMDINNLSMIQAMETTYLPENGIYKDGAKIQHAKKPMARCQYEVWGRIPNKQIRGVLMPDFIIEKNEELRKAFGGRDKDKATYRGIKIYKIKTGCNNIKEMSTYYGKNEAEANKNRAKKHKNYPTLFKPPKDLRSTMGMKPEIYNLYLQKYFEFISNAPELCDYCLAPKKIEMKKQAFPNKKKKIRGLKGVKVSIAKKRAYPNISKKHLKYKNDPKKKKEYYCKYDQSWQIIENQFINDLTDAHIFTEDEKILFTKKMEAYDVKTYGQPQLTINTRFIPATASKKGKAQQSDEFVLIMHANGAHCGMWDFSKYVKGLCDKGKNVIMIDYPGQGQSKRSGAKGGKDPWEDIAEQVILGIKTAFNIKDGKLNTIASCASVAAMIKVISAHKESKFFENSKHYFNIPTGSPEPGLTLPPGMQVCYGQDL
ncbi:unnamed protein product, partial [marine sediment metagenome]